MNKRDLQNRLRGLVKEEVNSVLSERTYRHGGLLDPSDFDPVNPEVHIVGFGTMARDALRLGIARRLKGALKTAEEAAKGGSMSYDRFKTLQGLLEEKSVLQLLIKAEIEVAEELEQLRKKGGRRAQPIPKQF
jgi:hypothetical protein